MQEKINFQCDWHITFPHRVLPQQDEWLAGVLLRCDDTNHWNSGTTFRYLLHATEHKGFGPGPSFIVVPLPFLECLAQRVALPLESLLLTTYSLELARLYEPLPPHAKQ